MGIGWILSLITIGAFAVIIMFVVVPLERKHIVRQNGKIDYSKTTIYLRWNRFDTLTLCLSIYTILCVQTLNMLISFGQTVGNPFVQFTTNQAQAWTIIVFLYLIFRITHTLKSIKARWGDSFE